MVQSATVYTSRRSTSLSLSLSRATDNLNHASDRLNSTTVACGPSSSTRDEQDGSSDSASDEDVGDQECQSTQQPGWSPFMANIEEEERDEGTFERQPFIYDPCRQRSRGDCTSDKQATAHFRLPNGAAKQRVLRYTLSALAMLVVLVVALHWSPTQGFVTTSHTRLCPDPYAQPGYLLYQEKKSITRWIPYTDDNTWDDSLREGHHSDDFGLPTQRRPYEIAQAVLDSSAPPSFATALRNKATRQSDPTIDFLKGKKIVILGSSLDRNALESFCTVHHGQWTADYGARGLHNCLFKDLEGFSITFAFTFGTLELDTDLRAGFVGPPPYRFEDRVEKVYLPGLKKRDNMPDFILWASGTWSVLGIRKKLRSPDPNAWTEEPMGWDELNFDRQRLREIHSYITTAFPGVPLMYRPPTYLKAKGTSSNSFLAGVNDQNVQIVNAGVHAYRQSAESAMLRLGVPIFQWAEKLIGSMQYEDPVHFARRTGADWLYGEMLLWYLRYYTSEEPSFCTSDLARTT